MATPGLTVRRKLTSKLKLLIIPVLALVAQPIIAMNLPEAFANEEALDTTAPTLTITNLNSRHIINTVAVGNKLTVSGAFTDNVAPNYGHAQLVDNVVGSRGLSTFYGSPSGTYSTTMAVDENLPDGKYTINVWGTDFAGNVSGYTSVLFTVDNNQPTTDLIIEPLTSARLAPASFTVRGVASDAISLNRVHVQLVNRETGARMGDTLIHLIGQTQSAWSRTYNAATDGLPEGTYAAHVTVVDMAGNVYNSGWSENFKLDATAPRIIVKDGYLGNKEAGVFRNVSFSLYDAQQVDRFTVNGVNYDRTNNTWSDANFQNIVGSLVQGENVIVLYDVAGNTSEYRFVYDTSAPTATFMYSNNNGAAVTNQDVTVTLISSEPIVTPAGWEKVSDTEFTKVYSENAKSSVVISDIAGNITTLNYEVKRIDKTAPVVAGVVEGETYQNVSFTVTDQNFSHITINGERVNAVKVSGWQYAPAQQPTADGDYEIVAYDKAGNETSVAFSILAPAPLTPVVAPVVSPAQPAPAPAPAPAAQPAALNQVALQPTPVTYFATGDTQGEEVLGETDVVAQNEAEDTTESNQATTLSDDTEGEVYAAQDDKTTGEVWGFAGIAWYWWLLLAILAIGLLSWFIAGRRRHDEESER